jgi:hypothetical protein
MHDIDKPDDEPSDIPESGPWEGPSHCVMKISEPFDFDGKLVRAISARHSDEFVCLRFEDVEPGTDGDAHDTDNSDLSF